MELISFTSGPLDNNVYVIFSDHEAVVIDPAFGSADEINRLLIEHSSTLVAIWITHSHLDHTAGCSEILRQHKTPIFIHQADADNLIHPGSDGLPTWPSIPTVRPSRFFRNKQRLSVGKSIWIVLHTPGHSPGSVCFYNAEQKILLSGDTLFRGTMGNTSFPQSCPILMEESLTRLSELPLETTVYPGHGPNTTISREKHWMKNSSDA